MKNKVDYYSEIIHINSFKSFPDVSWISFAIFEGCYWSENLLTLYVFYNRAALHLSIWDLTFYLAEYRFRSARFFSLKCLFILTLLMMFNICNLNLGVLRKFIFLDLLALDTFFLEMAFVKYLPELEQYRNPNVFDHQFFLEIFQQNFIFAILVSLNIISASWRWMAQSWKSICLQQVTFPHLLFFTGRVVLVLRDHM